MAVTRSWSAPGAAAGPSAASGVAPVMLRTKSGATPAAGLGWLLAASLLVAAGLAMVYAAKIQRMADHPTDRQLNLNKVGSPDDLLPILEFFPNRDQVEMIGS